MKKTNTKIWILSAFTVLLGTLLLFNVLLIDVKGKHFNSGTDLNNFNGISYVDREVVPANRGRIYDGNGILLAEDVEAWDVVAYISSKRPGNNKGVYYVRDKEGTAERLATLLGADYDEILSLLKRDSFMTYLGTKGRGISTELKEEIEAEKLPGIEFVKVAARNYTSTPYASHLIGFARYTYQEDGGNNDVQGKTGLEAALNSYMIGTPGYHSYYKDTTGKPLVGMETEYVSSINGNDVYLTLDNRIQSAMQTCLKSSYDGGTRSKFAWGIAIEAKTGKIIAYDTYPTFDQNKVDITDYLDYNIMASYEPGSVMKTFAYAAAIDQGKFSPDDTFNGNNYYLTTKNGRIARTNASGKYIAIIRNNLGRQYGETNFWSGFARSMNSGAVTLLEKYIDQDIYKQYLYDFGFFKPVEVFGLLNEAEGIEALNTPFNIAASTFGQGSAFTALQIVQAYTTFANKGYMLKPYIIDRIVDSATGEIVYEGGRQEVRQVIKESSCKTVLDMMEYTVASGENGSAKRYGTINGVRVGGKTGTAEAAENGRYGDLTIHSMVVNLPADDPQVILYVCYEDYKADATNHKAYNELARIICDSYGLFNREEGGKKTSDRKMYQDAMPNLTNHSLEYTDKKINGYNLNVIKVGTGNTVLQQYPLEGSTLVSGQNVLLLLSREGIKMPDMKGWSRKDVTAFWQLTGIEVVMNGSGYVSEQNIAPQTDLTSASRIEVILN